MRWTLNEKPVVSVGDSRKICRFLWAPLRIRNEVRWLTVAHIEERAEGEVIPLPLGGCIIAPRWTPVAFID